MNFTIRFAEEERECPHCREKPPYGFIGKGELFYLSPDGIPMCKGCYEEMEEDLTM
jgi:hypothetical protein